MKIALIGLGTMGHIHAEIWSKMPGIQFVAACGQNMEKTMQFAEIYGVTPHFSLDDLLQNVEFDVLDICLPTYLHRDYTVQAAISGKHIICEKPIALHVEEAIEMIAVCKKYNVRLFIGHVLRFFPEYAQSREKVHSGALGKIGVVKVSRNSAFPLGSNDWYSNPLVSGGLTLDLLVHDFDWIRWTFGEVERVTALRVSRTANHAKLEYVLATMRMKDGAIVHVEGSWSHKSFTSKFEIAGDKGTIVSNMAEAIPLAVYVRNREEKQDDIIVPHVILNKDPVQRELEHFVDCLWNDHRPVVMAEDALEALKITQAALLSVELGQPIQLGLAGGVRS